MDNLSKNSIEVAMNFSRLLSCEAESTSDIQKKMGGTFEVSSEIQTPAEPSVLKENDSFAIKIFVSIIGRLEDSEEEAFSATCGFEGDFSIVSCSCEGVAANNITLWSLAAGQLHPLVSRFLTDIILRMGFSNINIPPVLPGNYTQTGSSSKNVPKRKRKK